VILTVLPVLCFCLFLLYLGATNPWRVAFTRAAVLWGLLVAANTEVLSLFGVLALPWLSTAWAVECCTVAFGVWRRRVQVTERLQLPSSSRLWHPSLVAVAPVLIIVAATGITAWMAPPNTWDSMTYHIARVAHWVADGTVALYPTNIVRQLYSPPWSEYAVLQLQVLSGSDHLANLVQWFSMVGSVVVASLIAQQLGSQPRGQLLAMIVVATLPMGILQASSTQTDYVVAFWLLCSVSLALSFWKQSTQQGAAWLASSLGLAMLTKGTAYLIAAPIVVFLGFWMLARVRRGLITPALLMLFIPLVINSGYYFRNEALFHNPLGTNDESVQLVNTSYTPQVIMSNAARDAVLQFGTPNPNLNNWLERAVAKFHSGVLHIGVNDPATTFPGATFQVNALSFDEDYAGDPLQALLAIAAVLAAIGFAFRRGPPLFLIYSLGLIFAFLTFAAYLRWQPWHARLELPLLVLSAPLIGAVVARLSNFLVLGALGAVLIVAAVPWVIDNQSRPMVGFALPAAINAQPRYLPAGETIFNTPRIDLYFVKRPYLEGPYAEAVARAAQTNCREIALWSGADDWEYPLWVLANQSGGQIRIDHIFIGNESIAAHQFGSKPCLILDLTSAQPLSVALNGVRFTQLWSDAGVALYVPV
jgi:hypothetical protein